MASVVPPCLSTQTPTRPRCFPAAHHHPLPFSPFFPSTKRVPTKKCRSVRFSLAESEQPNSLQQQRQKDSLRPLLQEIADSFVLPSDYFAKLPRDLRLDVDGYMFLLSKQLNDAGFDLSQGSVLEECGQELGEMLLNLSRAWELADATTSHNILSKLPVLENLLTDNVKSGDYFAAGRRYQSMGQYGQGELQRIAKALVETGKLLSAGPVIASSEAPKTQSRTLKFGELQVELTPQKAYIGAAIGLVYGVLSWELGQGVASIPEISLDYANDNALLLAKSLRGSLLALCFSSAILSACATVGLILLGRRLSSMEN